MEEKVFRTKTGFCHILQDKIVLTRNGIFGSATNAMSGKSKSIRRTLIIYGFLAVYFAYKAFTMYSKGDTVWAFLYSLFVVFNTYVIVISVNNSNALVIARSTIRSVNFKNAKPGITRSYFEIFFEDDSRIKKRLIMLPGSLSNGNAETQKALKIMRGEGLLQD
jgi:hypothetical protein